MGVDDEDDENEEMPFTVHLAQLRNGQPVLQRIEKFEPFRGRKITVNQMGCITIIYNYSLDPRWCSFARRNCVSMRCTERIGSWAS